MQTPTGMSQNERKQKQLDWLLPSWYAPNQLITAAELFPVTFRDARLVRAV